MGSTRSIGTGERMTSTGWDSSNWTPKPEYTSESDDLVTDFYAKAMTGAIAYDRITGFFSSGAFLLYWPQLRAFVERRGRIRLLCSPRLSEDDAVGVERGYAARDQDELREKLIAEVDHLLADPVLRQPAAAFSGLVASGVIDVKLARVAGTASPSDRRMFHDKVGLFTDRAGRSIGFRGSANETYLGLSAFGHIESIDAWPSWTGDRDSERARSAVHRFERLWTHQADGVEILELPDGLDDALRQRVGDRDWQELVDEMTAVRNHTQRRTTPTGLELRRQQVAGLENWEAHGKRGILAHATGSGKTVTGIYAIAEHRGPTIVVVPTEIVARQWVGQIRAFLAGTSRNVHICGAGENDWKQRLHLWLTDPESYRIVVALAPTASSDRFLSQARGVQNTLLVADEVHRLGARSFRRVLSIDAPYRLGLSATPERAGDPDGTAVVFDYFGGIVDRYTLEDAMHDGVLCEYLYHPQVVHLTGTEEQQWADLTRKIGRAIAAHGGDTTGLLQLPAIKIMIMQRARIARKASTKISTAVETVRREYTDGDHWLVYCDDRDQMLEVAAGLRDARVNTVMYYSDMAGDKQATLRHFRHNGGVVVSIKCLDEGVDIPDCDHAMIVASSRNPREFIQRRGRVLRKSADKQFAVIHDILVVPSSGVDDSTRQLVWGEIARAGEFARSALNTDARIELEKACLDLGINLNDLYTALDAGVEADEEEEHDP